MQDIFDFDGSDIENQEYSDDEENEVIKPQPEADQNLEVKNNSQLIDLEEDLLNLDEVETEEMKWAEGSDNCSPDLFKGDIASIDEFQPPEQVQAWNESKDIVKEEQIKAKPRKTKEDFNHEPLLLFDCLYCVSSERAVCKGVLQKSITDNYYQKHIQASNNDTIFVSLPGLGEGLKVTDQQVENYFDQKQSNILQTNQNITTDFYHASLMLKSLEVNVPERKKILKAKLVLVQSDKQLQHQIAQELVQEYSAPQLLYQSDIYKAGLAYNKIRTQILNLPAHLTYQNQTKPNIAQPIAEEQDLIQEIESSNDSNTFIQGEVIGVNRWAMTRRQRIQRRLSFDSVMYDIYKPKFSSEGDMSSNQSSYKTQSSVDFELLSEENKCHKLQLKERDGFRIEKITKWFRIQR